MSVARIDALAVKLDAMRGISIARVDDEVYEVAPQDSVYSVGLVVGFDDGAVLRCQFWRLTEHGRAAIGVFDHRQRYGHRDPIDAFSRLRARVVGRELRSMSVQTGTGDLRLSFDGGLVLEVFNFTAFEIWEIRFADGTGELSNYVLD